MLFWKIIILIFLLLRSAIVLLFYDELRYRGLNIESQLFIYVELLFFVAFYCRNNFLGRRGVMIVSFINWTAPLLSLVTGGANKVIPLIFNSIDFCFHLPIFIYLCSPKVSRYFREKKTNLLVSS